jgi:hypothetical protein
VAVIIPALNEEQAIQLVLGDIPQNVVEEVIVVDNVRQWPGLHEGTLWQNSPT